MFTVVRPVRLTAGLTALVAAASAGWGLGVPAAPAQAAAHQAAARPAAARPAAASRTATTVPPGRQWASFAYDPQHHELVLFGGNSSSTVFGDTWTRQRGLWKQRHPARSPSARTGAAMAYDAATGQLLLFGGSARPGTGGGFDGQTWIWTGHTWRRLHPATSPPARHNADMIYDAASQDVILFGGYDGHYLGDTWAWTGTTWTQLSPATSPSPRDSESLVYDPASQTAIMYGGFNSEASRLSDTWSWNGTTWTQLSPATTPGVITFAWQAGYDASSQQVLLFGGDPGNGRPPHNGTWAWTGATWAQLSPAAAPRGRTYGSLAYDGASQQPVLFGGSANGRETVYPHTIWTWDGSTWHRG
jgi:hypothetical protein